MTHVADTVNLTEYSGDMQLFYGCLPCVKKSVYIPEKT